MPRSLFPNASPDVRAKLEQDPCLKLINEYDWVSNPLGPIPQWSESLKGAVRVMMSASTPMAMLVGEKGILIYNTGYAHFSGAKHPEIFGMSALDAWPEAADFNAEQIRRGLAGQSTSIPEQEFVLNRNGVPESTWLELHYSPVLEDTGEPIGSIAVVHEITDRILAEKALSRSEERLSLALNGTALVGTWDWNVIDDVVIADDQFADLFGLEPLKAGLGLPIEAFLHAIHPDDAPRVQTEIETALREGSSYESQYRLIGPDGAITWIVASGRPRRDANGQVYRFPGVAIDVSEQHRVAEALAESEASFRILADTMPQMVWATQPDGFHDYYNARWYEFTGVPAGSTDGEGWNGMFHPEDQERAWTVWRHSLETGEPYQIEYRLRHHTGEYRWTLGRALPIRDAQGQITRWIGTCTDIHQTRLAAQERELVAQELSHRIKNIFAVLSGIISLSARNIPEAKSFANQLRERIFALGEAHDFLRPHSHLSMPASGQGTLSAFIDRLMRPYNEGEGEEARVTFSGDDTHIDDAAATPLALLIHELATNAAKYGGLSRPSGRVAITGEVIPDGYRLIWRETGGPVIATPEAATGFGTRLVNMSVKGQMGGTLSRNWRPEGLEVEVRLPIGALSRSARLRSAATP